MELLVFTGFLLVLFGLWGLLSRRDIFKMIIGFSIMDTGIHVIIVAVGYLPGGKVPIFSSLQETLQPGATIVDPVPSALVLTAIVIGLAVTALMLSYAVVMHKKRKSTNIDDYKETI